MPLAACSQHRRPVVVAGRVGLGPLHLSPDRHAGRSRLVVHGGRSCYHRYAEHARTEHMNAAGCSIDRFAEHGIGIVLLETTCRFLRELRCGDGVEIASRLSFGEGKTFRMDHTLRRVSDGVAAAEIGCTMGLVDATARRLLPAPRARLLELATSPEVLIGPAG